MQPIAGWTPPPASPDGRQLVPLADLVEGTLGIYRRNALLLLGISVLVQLPFALTTVAFYQSALGEAILDPYDTSALLTLQDEIWGLIGLVVLLSTIGAIFGVFGGAAMTVVAARSPGERAVDPSVVGGEVVRLIPSLLGLLLLGLLATVGIFGVSILLVLGAAVLGVALDAAWLAVLLAIVAILVVVIVSLTLYARLALILPVVVLEPIGAWRAVGRSWNLVRGRVARTLGIVVVAGIGIGLISAVLSPGNIPGLAATLLETSVGTMAFGLLSAVVPALLAPILPILLTLLYLDYAQGPMPAEGPSAG